LINNIIELSIAVQGFWSIINRCNMRIEAKNIKRSVRITARIVFRLFHESLNDYIDITFMKNEEILEAPNVH